jgi:pimeloyl-ACP methyl ester carboxylesterase
MVFLSETACDGEVWKINQIEEFSRDHRVIIHDYRGTGQSSKPFHRLHHDDVRRGRRGFDESS